MCGVRREMSLYPACCLIPENVFQHLTSVKTAVISTARTHNQEARLHYTLPLRLSVSCKCPVPGYYMHSGVQLFHVL